MTKTEVAARLAERIAASLEQEPIKLS